MFNVYEPLIGWIEFLLLRKNPQRQLTKPDFFYELHTAAFKSKK